MLRDDLNGMEIFKKGDICINIADSLRCTAETNNVVKQLYSNFNKRKKRRWRESGAGTQEAGRAPCRALAPRPPR